MPSQNLETIPAVTVPEETERYFSVMEKLSAIGRVKKGERQLPVAHSIGISGLKLGEWFSQLASNDWSSGNKNGTSQHNVLDRTLYSWFIQELLKDMRPTYKSLLKKALVFSARIHGDSMAASESWLNQWLNRHRIVCATTSLPPQYALDRENEIEERLLTEERRIRVAAEEKRYNKGTPEDRKMWLLSEYRRIKALKDTNKTFKKSENDSKLKNGFEKTSPARIRHNGERKRLSQDEIALHVANDTSERKKLKTDDGDGCIKPMSKMFVTVGFDVLKAIDKILQNHPASKLILDQAKVAKVSDRLDSLEVQRNFVDVSLNRQKKQIKNNRLQLGLGPIETPRKVKSSSPKLKDGMLPSDVQDDDTPIEYTQEVGYVGQSKLEREHLPPFGPVIRKDLRPGMSVYAAREDTLSEWVKAKIQEAKIAELNGSHGVIFKVKFENRKDGNSRYYLPNLLAYSETPAVTLPVGSRVIARYKEDIKEQKVSLYAGIIAEPPKFTNNSRYLIFFDDGYAQYVRHFEVFLVCSGKKEVWEDISKDSSDFIKTYLTQYPERPMLKLSKNQEVLTEWNGKWWNAKVKSVDASLVEMYFDSDKRSEWIYRGSTRLAPLFNELKRAKENSGKPGRRHNTFIKKKHQPYVVYTHSNDDNEREEKRPQRARKHTGGENQFQQTARKSTTQEEPPRMARKSNSLALSQIGTSESCELLEPKKQKIAPHRCSLICVQNENPLKHRGQNPLRIPMLCGWHREIVKLRSGQKKEVSYRAPCGRRLRSIDEIVQYLEMTDSKLTIDLFCFDSYIHMFMQFRPVKICFYIRDMTYGKEPVPVCCVNSLNKESPTYVEYSSKRFPAKGVELNLDPEFLCGCDCTDNCRDSSKCQCQQLTVNATRGLTGGPFPDAGYKNRRLRDPLVTGVYECNERCSCRSSCFNRVAQNGLSVRLQVFRTERRGWGIRCLDDLPQGMFICIYAGILLNENLANQDGNQYGDEYQAELDHIEVMERIKEGYESDVAEDLDDPVANDSDSDYNGFNSDRELFSSSKSSSGPSSVAGKRSRKSSDENTTEQSLVKVSSKLDDLISKDKNRISKLSSSFGLKQNITESGGGMSVRGFYNEEYCYIMDAKISGNIGRYLNHSCTPNVFVQNVFVDTHDLRFPWVAFFAGMNIRAGTELTWDYNYEVGSVPKKIMYCYCGSSECRGRLL